MLLDTKGACARVPSGVLGGAVAADDYTLVEGAIAYLASHPHEHLDLAAVAAAVGLSEYQLQCLFKRWAGVSPRRFIQFLRLGYAKQVLTETPSLLQASYESGLSATRPQHSLFVTLDAVTPGGYRSGGEGLAIQYGRHDSPFGRCLLATTARGICSLSFVGNDDPVPLAEVRRAWPRATLVEDEATTAPLARRAFALGPAPDDEPLRLLVKGSQFQVQVWQELLRIPPAGIVAYSDVAAMVGRPRAVRAVAQAVAHNPISYLIPCHRVILKSGAFGNYGGNALRKQAMLAWEAAQALGEGDSA